MNKSANLCARIEPNLKTQAESILSALGIPASCAITMFYTQIVLKEGLPFDVKLPKHPLNVDDLSTNELNAELEKGYSDLEKGHVKRPSEVFSSLRKRK